MSSIIVDLIANMGFDAIKDKISDTINETQAKQKIINYLDQQQKLNFQICILMILRRSSSWEIYSMDQMIV